MSDEHQKSRAIRVLIVAPSYDILGGQSVQAARLLDRLQQEPSLKVGFLPINPRLPGPLRLLQRIKYVRTFVTSIAYILSLLFHVYKYDVIHVFSASYFSFVIAPTPAILIGKLYRRKVLLNYHSGEAADHLQRWRRTAIPTIHLVDAVIVPSEYLVKVFANFALAAQPIYNLIELSEFPFRDRAPLHPVFLSNRNLESHYGVDQVLRAFSIIQTNVPEAQLDVVGDGSQRRSLESLAADLGLKNIRFRGQVDPRAMRDVYDAADVYLNGSEIDNQPLSILEAFACGIPIVTTDAGGIPYIVRHGETGMVVPRGNFEHMSKCALELLRNPQLAKQLATRGRQESKKYSWEATKDSWLKTYYKLAEERLSTLNVNKDSAASSPRDIAAR